MIQGALEADGRIAAKNATKIRAALMEMADYKKIFLQYQETQPISTPNKAQDNSRARAWAIMNVRLRTEALASTLWRTWAEAYVLGEAAADEWIKKTIQANKAADDGYIDWKNWQPGDRATALMLRRPGAFQRLLEQTNATIKGMERTSLTDIGNALATTVELGLDAERASILIGKHVASASRALTIAITEQNRAMSAATIQRYKDADLQKMEWHVSDPCDKCAQNAGAVVPIGTSFPTGATQPPQHPHCRCVLLPVIPGMEEDEVAPTGTTLITPPAPPTLPPAFPTPKQEIEQTVARLQNQTVDPGQKIYENLDKRPFAPGKWEVVPREAMREVELSNIIRSRTSPIDRARAAVIYDIHAKKMDRDFVAKGVVYKNGPIEIQFGGAGLAVKEEIRQKVINEVEKLQLTNPKDRAVVHITKDSKNKYGWAYLGQEDLWVVPKIVKDTELKVSGAGGFKMPVTATTTQFEYTLSHEWGHLVDNLAQGSISRQAERTTQVIAKVKKEFPDAFKSRYSGENTREFYAEMFTEYYRTAGQTDNKLVQAMATEFGWKTPEAPKVIKAVYVKAKHDANYYLDNAELTEERLKSMIPTKARADGSMAIDWSAASGGKGPENIQLKNLMKEQGFLAKPQIVSTEEFQKIVSQGATPIYRGMGAQTQSQVDEYTQRLLASDDPFIGRGFFGDGTYFASDRGIAERFAAQDASGDINFKFGEVLEGVLDPQAKVIDVEDLWKLRNDYVEKMPYHGELAQAYEDDIGLFATTQGYDAIVNKNPMIGYTPEGQRRYAPGSYYTILNRSALIMKGKP